MRLIKTIIATLALLLGTVSAALPPLSDEELDDMSSVHVFAKVINSTRSLVGGEEWRDWVYLLMVEVKDVVKGDDFVALCDVLVACLALFGLIERLFVFDLSTCSIGWVRRT